MTRRATTIDLRTSLFEDAAAIIQAEYGEDLTIDAVAARVATSRRQLQRSFSEIGRTTFRSYLTAVRMDRAAALLRERRAPVREAAAAVGYRQPAQFAKAFRRHHGMTPSALRDDALGPRSVRAA
jgi:AraC-like DNA-binding protein